MQNLRLAYAKAARGKTQRIYVLNFEENLEANLLQLHKELSAQTYKPRPLTVFTVRDPKTRTISASDFKDRIAHHAVCNLMEPIFAKSFIHHSFANQKGKGQHKAILAFEKALRKNRKGYVLKADVRHYFDTVNHNKLLQMIGRRIYDEKVLWLCKRILDNHKTDQPGIGMPKGNLTSQFWGNLYLDALDQFVKHELKARHYIRYVDDFVIISKDKQYLEYCQQRIGEFLRTQLLLELHPEKTAIYRLSKGITFLGYRIYEHHRLLKRSNARRILGRIPYLRRLSLSSALLSLNGMLAYAEWANTYKFRMRAITAFLFGEVIA